MPLAYIGLGSNLGDRSAYVHAAIDKLHALPGTRVVKSSGLYESPAIDSPSGSPHYLNGVAEVTTSLPPLDLLRHLLAIERTLGRDRPVGVVNAPRTLDLDLIAYGNEVIETPEITLPHPRMHERLFVLTPLAELSPTWFHPTLRRTASELRDAAKRSAKPPVPYASGSAAPTEPLDTRGLTRFDRIAGGLGVAGCILLSLFLGLGAIASLAEMLRYGGGGEALIVLLLLAWLWIGTIGVVRYSVVVNRLDKLLKAGIIGESGHGFQVMPTSDALDAEVVASAGEGLPDDPRPASGPT